MHCPYCNASDTKVIDSRLAAEGAQVRRRRSCNSCQERFTTFEMVEVVMPRIIKSSGKIETMKNCAALFYYPCKNALSPLMSKRR